METHVIQESDSLVVRDARLRRLTARCGLSGWDWEDCVQEAYLALLVGHADWTMDEPRAWVWLRRVARNKAVDLRRRLRRHPYQSLDERSVIPRDGKTPDLRDNEHTTWEFPPPPDIVKVRKALRGLSGESRVILIQHAREDRRYAKIGEELGLTPGQVRSRYNWALHQVQKRLSGEAMHLFVGDNGEGPTSPTRGEGGAEA